MKCPIHQHLNWVDFVNGQVNDESDYQKALETCAYCLQLFVDSLENKNNLFSPSSGFVDKVMAGLPELPELPELNSAKTIRKSRYWHWINYVAAACLTIVLVHFGYFDYLLNIPEELQILGNSVETGNYFYSLMDILKAFLKF